MSTILSDFGLYVILTNPRIGHVAMAELCVEAGIGMLQLREKGIADATLLALARELCAVTRSTSTRLIINDRPDIALLSAADGVHVGQDDMAVEQVRRIVGPDVIVGLSTHSICQARQAQDVAGVDYIGFGPVYATTTKAIADPVVGTSLLGDVMSFSRLPVVAIGGIFPENISDVVGAGARNLSLVRYLMEAETRCQAAERIAAIQSLIGC